jgi:phenylpropionate dioxygenase-like ring-hydroxylating dioxygenase large terminal subunit
MPHFLKPAEESWTQHYPHLGTGPISFDDSITPESYELERKAIFERSWLNVGRVEQLPRKGYGRGFYAFGELLAQWRAAGNMQGIQLTS